MESGRIIRHIAVCLGAVSGLALATALPTAAENPCVEANPTVASDVAGATWTGKVTAVDETVYHQPAYDIVVDHVYAGTSGQLGAGATVHLVSAACFRVVDLNVGTEYLISVPSYPSPDGLVHSGNFAAWRLSGSSASFVLMHPGKPVGMIFLAAKTLHDAVALVAPGADLPETDTAVQNVGTPSERPPVWLFLAFVGFFGVLTVALSRRDNSHKLAD